MKKITRNLDFIMIVGILLLSIGLFYKVPSREFSFYEIKEYVGGDAYNGMIESAIRGGEIAGAMICKTLYICSGAIIISIDYFKIHSQNEKAEL